MLTGTGRVTPKRGRLTASPQAVGERPGRVDDHERSRGKRLGQNGPLLGVHAELRKVTLHVIDDLDGAAPHHVVLDEKDAILQQRPPGHDRAKLGGLGDHRAQDELAGGTDAGHSSRPAL